MCTKIRYVPKATITQTRLSSPQGLRHGLLTNAICTRRRSQEPQTCTPLIGNGASVPVTERLHRTNSAGNWRAADSVRRNLRMVNTGVPLCGMESNWHQLTPDSLRVAPRRIEQRKVSENGMQLVTIGDTFSRGVAGGSFKRWVLHHNRTMSRVN